MLKIQIFSKELVIIILFFILFQLIFPGIDYIKIK